MIKKKIIYSLTTRGLFSEISNLALAIIYARFHNEEIVVNTRNWNARIEKGWDDYFEKTIYSNNNYISSQKKIYTKERIWLGQIYYNPSHFFSFYFLYIANYIYKLFHPRTYLGNDIFSLMRSNKFLKSLDIKKEMSLTIKRMLVYNLETEGFILSQKQIIGISSNYIGVHIRRGDKITSHEMTHIYIQNYVDNIINLKNVSNDVYIATDDISIIDFISKSLLQYGFKVFHNLNVNQKGFDEHTFNTKNKNDRYLDTLNTILDLDILIHSSFFIGTYSSNLSRIVPLYIGFDKCISLDSDWISSL